MPQRNNPVLTKKEPVVINKNKKNISIKPSLNKSERPKTIIPRINKVMVGYFSSPYEARQVSKQITNYNPNVTPFIRERNGLYYLQVGAFTNPKKAKKLTTELRKRKFNAKILYEAP